ncbi:MAG: hypothetical protein NZ805_15865 [Armatimonadetes bacterium]|nr:hypothetical protein [Armatimonadota bacterium]MDW8028538.1 hypothetical protein [Armatimonadota bacterium]
MNLQADFGLSLCIMQVDFIYNSHTHLHQQTFEYRAFEINGRRFVIVNETYHRIRLRFPIVSLRPLLFRFWERETVSRTTPFRLPEGKDAFELKQRKKVAHLPLLSNRGCS